MIKKESILIPIDKSGALITKVFHLYKGFNRKCSHVGNFVKISVKTVKPESLVKKKKKSIALLTSLNYKSQKKDGSYTYFYENNCILFKRKFILRSKDIINPGDFNIKRRKFFYKFPGIL